MNINELPDDKLTTIFCYLPPYFRLRASEVCRRWHDLTGISWLDISWLDLTQIPTRSISPIAKHCPNLTSICADFKTLILSDLAELSNIELSSLKLYECKVAVRSKQQKDVSELRAALIRLMNRPSIRELVFHDLRTAYLQRPTVAPTYNAICFQGLFHEGLTHLQISGLERHRYHFYFDRLLCTEVEKLRNLECFTLCGMPDYYYPQADRQKLLRTLAGLKNLREICLAISHKGRSLGPWVPPFQLPSRDLVETVFALPKLEALFVNGVEFRAQDMIKLVTRHACLRILVITGSCSIDPDPAADSDDEDDSDDEVGEILIPGRRRFANGFGAPPLPTLNVFLGKFAIKIMRFTPSEMLKVVAINEAMPLFLVRPEIGGIFRGVWTAEMIKQAALRGMKFWDYSPVDFATDPVLYVPIN